MRCPGGFAIFSVSESSENLLLVLAAPVLENSTALLQGVRATLSRNMDQSMAELFRVLHLVQNSANKVNIDKPKRWSPPSPDRSQSMFAYTTCEEA